MLTDRNTFSSGFHGLLTLRKLKAIHVGEPSSQKLNHGVAALILLNREVVLKKCTANFSEHELNPSEMRVTRASGLYVEWNCFVFPLDWTLAMLSFPSKLLAFCALQWCIVGQADDTWQPVVLQSTAQVVVPMTGIVL